MEIKSFLEKNREDKLIEAEKHLKQKIAEAARFNAQGLSGNWHQFAFTEDRGMISIDNLIFKELQNIDLNDQEKKTLRSRFIPIVMFTDHDWQSIAVDSEKMREEAVKRPDMFSNTEKELIENHYHNLPRILNLTWRGIADFLDPEKEVEKENFSPHEIIGHVVSQLKVRSLTSRRPAEYDPDKAPFLFAYDGTDLGSKVAINGPSESKEVEINGSPGLFFLTHYNIAKNGVALAEDVFNLSLDKQFDEVGKIVADGKEKFLPAYKKELSALSSALEVRDSLLKKLKGNPFTINCEIVDDRDCVLVHIFDNGLGFDLNILKEHAKAIADAISNPQLAENDPQLQATVDSLSEEMKRKFKKWIVSPYYFKEILSLFPDLTKLNRLSGSTLAAGTGHSGLGLYACDVLMRKSGGDLVAGESATGGAWFCTIFPKDTTNVDEAKRKLRKGKLLPEIREAA